MTRWDTDTRLTDAEQKIKDRYAKAIVKSLFARCSEPAKLALLLERARECGLAIYLEATMLDAKGVSNGGK